MISPRVAILNYGIGNLSAISQALATCSVDSCVIETYSQFFNNNCTHIILPGVGHFKACMDAFLSSHLYSLIEHASDSGAFPILGICSGMQMLSSFSEEGDCAGLSLIPGRVLSLSSLDVPFTPHMGWNQVAVHSKHQSEPFPSLHSSYFYFVHSFYFQADESHVIASTSYQATFPCVVFKDNIFGAQFHPEKSHSAGLKFLSEFASLAC